MLFAHILQNVWLKVGYMIWLPLNLQNHVISNDELWELLEDSTVRLFKMFFQKCLNWTTHMVTCRGCTQEWNISPGGQSLSNQELSLSLFNVHFQFVYKIKPDRENKKIETSLK